MYIVAKKHKKKKERKSLAEEDVAVSRNMFCFALTKRKRYIGNSYIKQLFLQVFKEWVGFG